MKWTYLINQKLKVALAFLVVFVLVFSTNLLDKRYFSEIQESFTSVYDDRLVAENYLFTLLKQLQEKKQLFNDHHSPSGHQLRLLNDSIDHVIDKYEATKLTSEEVHYFTSLKSRLASLKKIEKNLISSGVEREGLKRDHGRLFQLIWTDLEALSEIQMAEGKRLISRSQQIVSSSKLMSRLEIAVLIIIGLIIQALIYSSRSLISRINQKGNLN